jgi:hypothetical protein
MLTNSRSRTSLKNHRFVTSDGTQVTADERAGAWPPVVVQSLRDLVHSCSTVVVRKAISMATVLRHLSDLESRECPLEATIVETQSGTVYDRLNQSGLASLAATVRRTLPRKISNHLVGPTVECVACFDSFPQVDGITCDIGTGKPEKHFFCGPKCNNCFQLYVVSQLDRSDPYARLQFADQNDSKVICPACRPAIVPYQDNALKLCVDQPTWVMYQQAIEEVKAVQKEQQSDDRWHRKLDSMTVAAQSPTDRVNQHRMHIVQEILTNRCPNPQCRRPFFDWANCFAVTCICRTEFCGWCGRDFAVFKPKGRHEHIAECPENVTKRGNAYDGSAADYRRSQAVQKARKVAAYFQDKVAAADRAAVIAAISIDLNDLGIEERPGGKTGDFRAVPNEKLQAARPVGGSVQGAVPDEFRVHIGEVEPSFLRHPVGIVCAVVMFLLLGWFWRSVIDLLTVTGADESSFYSIVGLLCAVVSSSVSYALGLVDSIAAWNSNSTIGGNLTSPMPVEENPLPVDTHTSTVSTLGTCQAYVRLVLLSVYVLWLMGHLRHLGRHFRLQVWVSASLAWSVVVGGFCLFNFLEGFVCLRQLAICVLLLFPLWISRRVGERMFLVSLGLLFGWRELASLSTSSFTIAFLHEILVRDLFGQHRDLDLSHRSELPLVFIFLLQAVMFGQHFRMQSAPERTFSVLQPVFDMLSGLFTAHAPSLLLTTVDWLLWCSSGLRTLGLVVQYWGLVIMEWVALLFPLVMPVYLRLTGDPQYALYMQRLSEYLRVAFDRGYPCCLFPPEAPGCRPV